MNKKRWSVIWKKYTSEELKEIVFKSKTLSEVLGYFGLINKGNNFKTLKTRLIEENVDYFHLGWKNAVNKGRCKKIPLEDILIEHSVFNRTHLKKRLLKDGLLKNQCSVCGLVELWNGLKIVMILDHINGDSVDNRIENLRMVCPNCDSQLDTFSGKNLRHCRVV